MCFLPPQCLFCRHYNIDAAIDERDCDAFFEIPDEIFRGRVDHALAVDGDGGMRFDLDPAMGEEFEEINALRVEMALVPFKRCA